MIEMDFDREPTQKELAILKSLHPVYTDDQLREGYANLMHYFALVWRIYNRLERDDPGWYEHAVQAEKFDTSSSKKA